MTNCPNCGFDCLLPYHVQNGDEPLRSYQCPRCHFRWRTVERLESEDQRQAFQATLFQILTEDARQRAEQRMESAEACLAEAYSLQGSSIPIESPDDSEEVIGIE